VSCDKLECLPDFLGELIAFELFTGTAIHLNPV
jgi:hypothetical protein